MRTINRVIGIAGTAFMIGLMFNIHPQEKPEIIDTVKLKEVHILTDKELSMLYTCRSEKRKSNPDIVEVSYEEAQMLMKIAKAEHGNGSSVAQGNVMKTVINRVEDDDFPDSIKEVILQPGQFSTVSSGKYYRGAPNIDSHIALALLEQGEINHYALYFEATHVVDSWMSQHKTFLFEAEGHRFYK